MAKTTFLTLPIEIRRNILDHVFRGNVIEVQVSLQPPVLKPGYTLRTLALARRLLDFSPMTSTPNILLTCKQVLREGLMQQWQQSELRLSSYEFYQPIQESDFDTENLKVPAYFKHVHTIKVQYDSNEVAASFLRLLPEIKVLNFGDWKVYYNKAMIFEEMDFAKVFGILKHWQGESCMESLKTVKNAATIVLKAIAVPMEEHTHDTIRDASPLRDA